MKNYDERSSICTPRFGHALLAVFSILLLSSCDRPGEQSTPPQAPPKPQVMTKTFSSDVEKALFSYSSKPVHEFQNGRGMKIERVVIHT
jgi:hypothetical protein